MENQIEEKKELITKIPLWLQIFYIISGSTSLIFAVIVLINLKFEYLITSILFGIALLTIGVTRIFVGLFDKRQEKSLAILNFITGILLIPIGLVAINKHDITLRIVFVFIAIAFLLLGIIGVVKGFQENAKGAITRLLLIVYGFLLIIVAITDLAVDDIAKTVLIVILSCGFILLGIRRLIDGVYSVRKTKNVKIIEKEIEQKDKKE